jgi:hypothetical protein
MAKGAMTMPKERNLDGLPDDDLDALTTAQADWDDVASDETLDDDDDIAEDEILEDVLGVDVDEEDEVIGEDDDNPYQESDEALPDDEEERDISRQLRRE